MGFSHLTENAPVERKNERKSVNEEMYTYKRRYVCRTGEVLRQGIKKEVIA